jgi:hypothetical protein
MNHFDYLKAINDTKQDIMITEECEKAYNSFMVNRGLSYFYDTVALANLVNQYHHLDKKLQFSFLINTVRKRKRFSKWNKPESDNDIGAIKEYYGYSNQKAKQIFSLLSADQIKTIKEKVSKGGKRK